MLWPSGKVAADNWLQCPGSKQCCAEGEACLSNGLCVAGKYITVYRGACTDKSWPISACPQVCYEGKSVLSFFLGCHCWSSCRLSLEDDVNFQYDIEITDGWANLYPCPSNNNEVFTCGTGGWADHVCEQQLGNYTWVNSNVTVAQLGFTSSSTATSSATTSASSGSTETTTFTSRCTASAAGNDATMKSGLGVGLGLGIPLLLEAAGMLWFYIHTLRQIQSLQQKLNEQGAVPLAPRGQYARLPPQELDTGKQNWPEIQSNYRSELS